MNADGTGRAGGRLRGVNLLFAFVAAIGLQTPVPPEEAERGYPEFSTVLSTAEWRLWLSEVAPDATPAGMGDESASQARLSRGVAAVPSAPEKINTAPGTKVALPEYSTWMTGSRECWLTAGANLHLRRLADGSYAALVVADQGGQAVVLGCGATEREGRLVFDRWIPWGPCREARVRAEGSGALALEPLGGFTLASEPGKIHIPARPLVAVPAGRVPAGPDVLSTHEWMEWTGRALRSVLPGLAADKTAVWKDEVFVFERADGLRWWVTDPRRNRVGDDFVMSAKAQDAQVRRIAKGEGGGDLTLPVPASNPVELDGQWVDASDSGHRLHLRGCGKGRVAALELIAEGGDVWGRTVRQLEGTLKEGRLTLKAGLMKSGATRLVASEIDGEVVLVSDSAQTLLTWNEKPAERAGLGGVWRKVKSK